MESQALATEIVRKLVNEGYIAYFAGGWVRDYLMEHPSDDIDIATNAPPDKILDLFPRTILVGLAFGVIIVMVDGHQFEVATFRRDIDYVGGRRPTQIELATPEEDASRRDFTINGMFYDPIEGVVHDFVHGAEDLKHQIIRCIGDPYERFMEDRLRMIRAVRFASRFSFGIDTETQEAIRANADTLFPAVAMERVWQEFTKMSKFAHFDAALLEMHRMDLLPTIFPTLKGAHLHDIKQWVKTFEHYPENTETILYLMALFPEITPDKAFELCKYLRISIAEARLAEYLVRLRDHVAKGEGSIDMVEWTHLYAHPASQKCLQIIAASMDEDKRGVFLNQHKQKMLMLNAHIKRIVDKKPLVNAELLQAHGVIPGKSMGLLLKEAERIVISNDIESAEQALRVLKTTSLWSNI